METQNLKERYKRISQTTALDCYSKLSNSKLSRSVWKNSNYSICCLHLMILEWLSRDNLSSPLFASVTYRHVKNWVTHSLDRNQTSCLDSKLLLTFINQNFQIMIFTLVNDHFIVCPSSVTLTFNLPEQVFEMKNCAKLFWNPCINVQVIVWTSSIYDHFLIWPSSVTLTFNVPEQMFRKALLLLEDNNCAK